MNAQFVFLSLLFLVVVFAALAQRLRVPYPIVLVVAGLAVSLIPGLPQFELRPNLVFSVFLPLLLYRGAWETSWLALVRNAGNIASLAVGLVVFTVAGIALAAPFLFRGFDWRAGLILGAVIAPTDAIAATAIARRLGLQKRLVDIIEGESLVNDASGLLALQFGLAIILEGKIPTIGQGILQFAWVTIAGTAVGLVIGFVVNRLERGLEDAPIVIAITIIVPYAAYFAADAIEASGVIAVVACGLYHSRRSDEFRSARVRLEASIVWNALAFVLNGILFVLIGLQLPTVMRALRGTTAAALIAASLMFAALVVLLRMVWTFPAMWVASLIGRLRRNEPALSARSMFVVGWSSMRGVIALAAALSLPRTLAQRPMIIFLTFGAIFFSLVLKAATLPALIRRLGLAGTAEPEVADLEARRMVLESALQYLDEVRGEVFDEHYEDLRNHYLARIAAIDAAEGDEHGTAIEHVARYRDLSRRMLHRERSTAMRLRDDRRISDEVLRELLEELDLAEARLVTARG